MIKSFRDKETEKITIGCFARRLPTEIQWRAKMRLARISAATVLEDLRAPPSHHLEVLGGDPKGQYSIRINNQWCVCFEWLEGNAYNVEITDYH